MAIVRHEAGIELTLERQREIAEELREAAKRPYVYDPDCPLLTEEQLAEFRPVNFATNEERLEAMRRMGVTAPANAAY
ncbi:MAG: hypothetical protein Pg6C_07300 [Treponemataceae bacterium]|nr:MAG: hypothetical protein Pg6C_07300 [Treponemataceae bacterium]